MREREREGERDREGERGGRERERVNTPHDWVLFN